MHTSNISTVIYKKSWLWLWECTKCGHETIESSSYLTRCECELPIFPKRTLYPCEVTSECDYCHNSFKFKKLNTCHHIKYCSQDCFRKAQRDNAIVTRQICLSHRKVAAFDRTKFCMRKDTGILQLCVCYSTCQNHRFDGDFGPHYKEDGSCFTIDEFTTHGAE